ncbi:MAG: hypothetical protein ACTSQJ_00235 [Promethearchaeota archaeon]
MRRLKTPKLSDLIEKKEESKKKEVIIKEEPKTRRTYVKKQTKILSEFEFKQLERKFNLIYNSNKKRYTSNRAYGMLDALEDLKNYIELIKNRLGY